MCQKSEIVNATNKFPRNVPAQIWPVPPYVALAMLSFLPTSCYLNRGFTIWFHWMSVFYLLTQSKFIKKFQILIGTSICLGWYAALSYEYFYHGRFMDALHKNMPKVMVNVMVKDGILDFESMDSLMMMGLSHILDMLGHPLLTYYFWRRHKMDGGKLSDVLSWPVIVSTYMYITMLA